MNFAVILSGGIGVRMGQNSIPKQYLEVNQKPILLYTLEKFQMAQMVDAIVIVAADEWQQPISCWLRQYRIEKFVGFAKPGATRQESILHGIYMCSTRSCTEDDLVIIHDAVRPMVSTEIISTCLTVAKEYGGCMPALPVTDTVYQSSDGKNIGGLLDRNTLFAGQSPEAFYLREYLNINNSVSRDELNSFKGTSEIAYKYGIQIRLISGDENNFKITTQKDLDKFKQIYEG